jgi:hypothetical protein
VILGVTIRVTDLKDDTDGRRMHPALCVHVRATTPSASAISYSYVELYSIELTAAERRKFKKRCIRTALKKWADGMAPVLMDNCTVDESTILGVKR